jgi:16S rRNA C967 or C1407 C5-methylase (RsmB/RsmF family)
MFPEAFIKRISGQKYIEPDFLLRALGEPSPASIRINPAKWDHLPVNDGHVPWCETGFYLNERPSFTSDPLFHAGCYYPQEASGMFIEQVLRQTGLINKDIKVLDLCGAPGGKSTHLSGLLGPESLLVANEVIRSRASVLSETVTRWGAVNTLVTGNDPSAFGVLQEYFDLILADVPCSGEGMFRNDTAVREWSAENTRHCSERQKRIINDIWPSLKHGGILIYSTCTFNPGENEENIKWITERYESETIPLNIDSFEGITCIEYNGIQGYGFYPDKIRGEGFFVSVIRKKWIRGNEPLKVRKRAIPGHAFKELDLAQRWTHFNPENIIRKGDEIISVPKGSMDLIARCPALRVVKSGTCISTVKDTVCLPSHELALSQGLKNGSFYQREIDLGTAISFLRRDRLDLHDLLKGWNLLTYRGINLGFVNNIGNRINNYHPVEWRIRLDMAMIREKKIISWQ